MVRRKTVTKKVKTATTKKKPVRRRVVRDDTVRRRVIRDDPPTRPRAKPKTKARNATKVTHRTTKTTRVSSAAAIQPRKRKTVTTRKTVSAPVIHDDNSQVVIVPRKQRRKRTPNEVTASLRRDFIVPIMKHSGVTHGTKKFLPTLNKITRWLFCAHVLPCLTGSEYHGYDWLSDTKKLLRDDSFIERLNAIWNKYAPNFINSLQSSGDIQNQVTAMVKHT